MLKQCNNHLIPPQEYKTSSFLSRKRLEDDTTPQRSIHPNDKVGNNEETKGVRAANLIRTSKEIRPPWDALADGVKVILRYY